MTDYEKAAQVVADEINKPLDELTDKDILEWRRRHGTNGAWCGIRLELQNIRVAKYSGMDFNGVIDSAYYWAYANEFPEKCTGIGIAESELDGYRITGWPEPNLEGIYPEKGMDKRIQFDEEIYKCAEWMFYKNFEEENGRPFIEGEDRRPDEMDISDLVAEMEPKDIFRYRAEHTLNVKNPFAFITDLSGILNDISHRQVPSKLSLMYGDLATSYSMMYNAASLLDIEFVWLDNVRNPLPHDFSEEWERCYNCLVRAKEYLDSVSAIYPGKFNYHWNKCHETYESKMYIVNISGCYDYAEIEKIRVICVKHGLDVDNLSDSVLWNTLVG